MAEVRVRYTGKQPIVVNGMTWFQDEIHTVNEKTANALVAMRKQQGDVAVLPLPGMVEPERLLEELNGTQETDGTDGAQETDVAAVVEEKPKRKRK